MGLGQLTNLVDSVGKNADNLSTSKEEIMQQVSNRHTADMMSDSWMSKNVRPIAFFFAMFCQLLMVLGSAWLKFYDKEVDPWIIGQVGALLATTTGFYFTSRKGEKMAASCWRKTPKRNQKS